MTRSLTVTLALLLTCACGAGDPTGGLPPGDAQLAVLNALPSGSVATLVLDDQMITLPGPGDRISRVIPAGTHRIEARREGGGVMASAHFSVAEGGRRTAIIGGTASSQAVTVLVGADTAGIPTGDAVKIRVVHTVQGTPTLEAWLTPLAGPGTPGGLLWSPFPYGVGLSGEFPTYVVRAPGFYRIHVINQATATLQTELIHSFGAGQVWSVVLTRRADGELELVPIREH
jgi:hypothetical protein